MVFDSSRRNTYILPELEVVAHSEEACGRVMEGIVNAAVVYICDLQRSEI